MRSPFWPHLRARRHAAAAPPSLLPEPAPGLIAALTSAVGSSGVRSRASDRLALGHDASHYALTPAAVVTPTDAPQVAALLKAASQTGAPLTFRSGGTSLSGQGVTADVLVDTRAHFRTIDVLDQGARVRVGPGATIRAVNARLARYGRKLGPDPASEIACTIGGMVANNSSGMSCGTTVNTYQTLESLVVVLPSGTVLDTAASDADDHLRSAEPNLYQGLIRLRERVRRNPNSVRTIERLFSMKNTMGYGVNSLLDHTRPVDILAHLMVGSEGTLAFIASATLRTVPVLSHAMTGLLVFEDLNRATGSLPALVATGPATIELMDATSLRVAQSDPAADGLLTRIAVDRHTALLVEYQADSMAAVLEQAAAAASTLSELPVTSAVELAADPVTRAALWHARKGLYAAVAGGRPSGSTALLEDIVVPVPALLPTCETLTEMFARHQYGDDCVIFGHAKDGNVHFMINEQISSDRSADPDLSRLEAFTEDLVDLVLGHGGSLKAEHGTGRMMAPYVRRQYGDELYEVMREIKQLFDHRGLLNPGVILTDDPGAHLRHLKTTGTIEPEVDRCVECGYCEPVCPSRNLTTTPRQRIVLRREMLRAEQAGDTTLVKTLRQEYEYDAIDTCAVDGMCQTACPVLINTGDLVRKLRQADAGQFTQAGWKAAAKHFDATTRAAATAMNVAQALPAPLVAGTTAALRKVLDPDTVPAWTPELPGGGRRRGAAVTPQTRNLPSVKTSSILENPAQAVFFPACVGTMFGPAAGGPGSAVAFQRLCDRAGVTVTVPKEVASLCCGTPWKSKGLSKGYAVMQSKLIAALWQASDRGTIPIVVDASSCAEGLHETLGNPTARQILTRLAGYRSDPATWAVVDSVQFVAQHVLPRLRIDHPLTSIALHPTCSSTRLGTNGDLLTLARAVADEVVIPDGWSCCAFAGDRGMLHPELTASATADEVAGLGDRQFQAYASCNRTCELGMTRATGHQYQHVLELLDQVSNTTSAGLTRRPIG